MSASHPVTKTVQEFDRFCPQVGEGLTGRAAGWSLGQVLKHLRAVQRTHPKMRSGSAIDSRLVPLRDQCRCWKRFWQKMNFVDAIKADRVVRSDAGISFENLLICSLSLLSKRSTRNSLPQSARATKHSAVSCAAMARSRQGEELMFHPALPF